MRTRPTSTIHNQSAAFEPADLKDARVSRAAECLLQNRFTVPMPWRMQASGRDHKSHAVGQCALQNVESAPVTRTPNALAARRLELRLEWVAEPLPGRPADGPSTSATARHSSAIRGMGARRQIGAGIQGDRLFVPDRRSAETTDGLLRFSLSHHWSERLSLDAFLGPVCTRRAAGGAGRLALKYGGLRTDFSLTIGRQLAPSCLGTLTVQESAQPPPSLTA